MPFGDNMPYDRYSIMMQEQREMEEENKRKNSDPAALTNIVLQAQQQTQHKEKTAARQWVEANSVNLGKGRPITLPDVENVSAERLAFWINQIPGFKGFSALEGNGATGDRTVYRAQFIGNANPMADDLASIVRQHTAHSTEASAPVMTYDESVAVREWVTLNGARLAATINGSGPVVYVQPYANVTLKRMAFLLSRNPQFMVKDTSENRDGHILEMYQIQFLG